MYVQNRGAQREPVGAGAQQGLSDKEKVMSSKVVHYP